MKSVFTGIVQDGKLLFDDAPGFQKCLQGLANRPVEVSIGKRTFRRSKNQNAYYWGVCIKLIAEHTGAEPEEIHTALKFQFSPKKFVGNLVAPASSALLDTIDFEAYLDKVRRWAMEELNIYVPLPNEVDINN